jgi:uncharacterized protein YbjT (DUF2867 family)
MHAPTKIAVAGATGRVGRHVVDVLRAGGHDVVPISRTHGVDVVTGDGLDAALVGVHAVVDAATGASPEQEAAEAFFAAATRNLHAAGQRAGVRRIAVVSIIGSDRFASGYGAAKVSHERAMLAGPVPARILRAAQFHEFVEQLVDWGRDGDVTRVPAMRTQPVAAQAVAEALADLALAESAPALIAEIAGPREERLADLAARFVAHRDDALRIEEVSDPDHADVFENGGLLPGPDATLSGPSFDQWLAA